MLKKLPIRNAANSRNVRKLLEAFPVVRNYELPVETTERRRSFPRSGCVKGKRKQGCTEICIRRDAETRWRHSRPSWNERR